MARALIFSRLRAVAMMCRIFPVPKANHIFKVSLRIAITASMTTSVLTVQIRILSFHLCAASVAQKNMRPSASFWLHGASNFRFMHRGAVRTSVSSVTTNSLLWSSTDLIISLDRKLKSLVFVDTKNILPLSGHAL